MRLFQRSEKCISTNAWALALAALAAALVVTAFAGCSSRPLASAQSVPQASVRVAVPSGEMARALASAAEAYASGGSGEPISIEVIDSKLYDDRVSAALLAGLDTWDLLLLDAGSIPRWAKYGGLRPLEQPPGAENIRQWLSGLVVEGDLYALPARPDPLVLWYRTDLLQAAEITPEFPGWPEVVRAAQAAGGIALAGDGAGVGADFLTALAGTDPQAFAALVERGEVTPAAVDALEEYASLFGSDGLTLPGSGKSQGGDVFSALESGGAALGFAPLSGAGRLLDCSKERASCREGRPLLQAANLPGTSCASMGRLSVWAVPLHAPRAAAAIRFAAWLASENGGLAWSAGGGLPANREALKKISLAGEAASGTAASLLVDTDCYWVPFSGLPTADEAWKALDGAVHQVLAGEESAALALNEAGEKIQKALRQGGVLK